MGRKAKFRAWDKVRKLWFIPFIGGSSGKVYLDRNFQEFLPETDYELVQYTGLTDKNSKEICEGDIVKNGDAPQYLVVFYQAPSFVMKWKIKRGYSKHWSQFILSPEQNQFQEIIGNIYENPELIKQ